MKYSDNIPSFNDICGTVTQALAENILNREAIIAELRQENARAQQMLHERTTNYTNRCEEVERLEKIVKRQRQSIRDLREEIELDTCISASAETELVRLRADLAQKQHECEDLKKQIEGWRTECEIHEKDEKELYSLRISIAEYQRENHSLRTQLFVSQNEHEDCDKQCKELLIENQNLKEDFGRGDAYWTAIRERDDARRRYCELVHNTEGSTVEKIAHFNGWNDLYPAADNTPSLFEQKSDSDPVTGVQYGDLV